MKLLRQLAWAAFALAAAHVLVGLVMSASGGLEGPLGGVFYAVMYGTPLVAIGLALTKAGRWPRVAGWVALVLGVYYALIIVGNWSGYSPALAVFAVAITAPTTALDLVIFWAAVLRRPHRLAPPA